MDPVTLALLVAAAHALSRLAEAAAQWLTLHARAQFTRAAAVLHPGVELVDRYSEGGCWLVRTSPQQEGRKL